MCRHTRQYRYDPLAAGLQCHSLGHAQSVTQSRTSSVRFFRGSNIAVQIVTEVRAPARHRMVAT